MWEPWEDIQTYIYGSLESLKPHQVHEIIKPAIFDLFYEYLERDEDLQPFKKLFVE